MKKKKLILLFSLFAAVAIPASVFAATSDTSVAKSVRGFFGIDASKLTDDQKADVSTYSKKMADLQKEFINKMVENGSMTKEQGDAEIERIDEALQNGKVDGLTGGFNRGGKKGEAGMARIDTSKLTDEQKKDLTESSQKMAALQKELIGKMVANGLMTKEQGDAVIKKVDEAASSDKLGTIGSMWMDKGGFFLFGMKGIDTSKLTDVQKADLTDYSKKMADLQKELINKMVSSGLMTKTQGDTAIERIDNMQENGFMNKSGMMKRGNFRGGERQDASQGTTDNTAASM